MIETRLVFDNVRGYFPYDTHMKPKIYGLYTHFTQAVPAYASTQFGYMPIFVLVSGHNKKTTHTIVFGLN